MRASPAIPPTTPPAIAPLFVVLEEEFEDCAGPDVVEPSLVLFEAVALFAAVAMSIEVVYLGSFLLKMVVRLEELNLVMELRLGAILSTVLRFTILGMQWLT